MAIAREIVVLNKFTFGPSPQAVAEIRRRGVEAWLAEQLRPDETADPRAEAAMAQTRIRIRYAAGEGYAAVDELRGLDTLAMPPEQLWRFVDSRNPFGGPERARARVDVAAATVVRAVHSRWQIRELLCDFWHNHFNVNATDAGIAAGLPDHDRTIRSHALGNFRALLEAIAQSPSMLVYLNNRSSRAGAPNENFARELLELHTLGRNNYLNALYNRWREVPGAGEGRPQGYIDEDVYEAARAFTGWSIEDGAGLSANERLPATGRFRYVDAWHDPYQKRVLAAEFEPFREPQADGRKVLDILASHPGTAQFVCTKLVRRLVADEPPQSLIDAAVAAWRENLTAPDQIAQVIRSIALHRDLASTAGRKLKRPLELLASFARAAEIDLRPTDGLLNELDAGGQRLFGWPPPTGHPDDPAYWLSSNALRRRLSLLLGLAENWWAAGTLPTRAALDGTPVRAGDAVRAWQRRLLGHGEAPDRRAAVLAGMNVSADEAIDRDEGRMRRLVAYVAMSPEFQMR
ncbi:MAG: DUF1800 domain-containing protein [Alphaproteobacteria bacterium]|nr:DUF1800 domain-containing protein [Alphaproteobacteria bacterium]